MRRIPELGLPPDAALRLDAAGTIVDANEAAAGMLAADPAAVLGRHLDDFIAFTPHLGDTTGPSGPG